MATLWNWILGLEFFLRWQNSSQTKPQVHKLLVNRTWILSSLSTIFFLKWLKIIVLCDVPYIAVLKRIFRFFLKFLCSHYIAHIVPLFVRICPPSDALIPWSCKPVLLHVPSLSFIKRVEAFQRHHLCLFQIRENPWWRLLVHIWSCRAPAETLPHCRLLQHHGGFGAACSSTTHAPVDS